MTDTEPLDLDALISGSNGLVVEAREYIDVLIIANRKPGPSSVDIMSRQADALEALIAELRQLRGEDGARGSGVLFMVTDTSYPSIESDEPQQYAACIHGYDEGICAECYPITHPFFGGNA